MFQALAKCLPVPNSHHNPSITALLPKQQRWPPPERVCGLLELHHTLALAVSLRQDGGRGPGELGLSRTCRPTPASAAPGIFKALHCQELITGCAAAASSAVYIISRFLAFALLLIYRSHLLTPNNPWMITLVVPRTQQKPWHPQLPWQTDWSGAPCKHRNTEMGSEQKKMSGEAGHLPQRCGAPYTSHPSTAGGGSWDPHTWPHHAGFSVVSCHRHPQSPQCCPSPSPAPGRAYQQALALVLGWSCPATAPRPHRLRGTLGAPLCLAFRYHRSGIRGFQKLKKKKKRDDCFLRDH